MFFGEKSFQKPQKGLPPSLRRQLLLLVVLLAGVLLIGLQFLNVVGRQTTLPPGPDTGGEPGFGTQRESGDLGTPRDPVEPEPFVVIPEVLERGKDADRTPNFDEKLLVYLLQKVVTQEESLEGDEPVLSLAREGDDVWQRILDDPQTYRGKLLELQGEVLSPEPGRYPIHLRGLEWPNPSGLDRAYQSYMVGVDGKFYMVATARKQRELAHREAVRLRCFFCQLYTYPVQYRGELRKATIPFVVGDDYELLPRPAVESSWSSEHLPLLGAVAAFVFVAWVLLRRRSARLFEQRRQAAKTGTRGPTARLSPTGVPCKCGDPRCRGECRTKK